LLSWVLSPSGILAPHFQQNRSPDSKDEGHEGQIFLCLVMIIF
jgi:hypothetical protein